MHIYVKYSSLVCSLIITGKIYCCNSWHGSVIQINLLLLYRFHTQINHRVIQLCPNTNRKGINLRALSGSILVTESDHWFISQSIQHLFRDTGNVSQFSFPWTNMCAVSLWILYYYALNKEIWIFFNVRTFNKNWNRANFNFDLFTIRVCR